VKSYRYSIPIDCMRRFYNQLMALLLRRKRDDDLEEEIAAHLIIDAQQRMDDGASAREAYDAARRELGSPLLVKEQTRQAWGWNTFDSLFQDLRYAARILSNNRRFAAIAALTLAIGIGANTAIFSIINGLLLQPLPYDDTDSLFVITERNERTGEPYRGGLSYLNALDWIERQHSFSDLALYRAPVAVRTTTSNGTAIMPVRMVSTNFFSVLGVKPLVGRFFTEEEGRNGAPPTIILSYTAWLRAFGGTYTDIRELSIDIDRQHYRVVGVLPRDFTFYGGGDMFIPIGLSREPWTTERQRRPNMMALGRLRAGVTREQARIDLANIAEELARFYPQANKDRGAAVTPILDDMIGADLRSSLYFIFAAVACVLLIACANVANLLLARGRTRQKEIALRAAVGAGRWRVTRQLIVESVLLAAVGAAGGLFVAIAATDLLVMTAPGGLPRLESVGIHWPVLLFSLGISLGAGILAGVAPAWQAARMDVNSLLKQNGPSARSGSHTVQKLIAAGEIALALVLLLAAGLVLRSTSKTLQIDPGFDPNGVISFAIVIGPNEYKTGKEVHDTYRAFEDRLRTIPGVEAASMAFGNLPKPLAVNHDYLRVAGVRLLAGRFFDQRDTLSSIPVAVIDERVARSQFPGIDPLGKRIKMDESFGTNAPEREIIGVVNGITRFGINPEGEGDTLSGLYFPMEQVPDDIYEGAPGGLQMLVRSNSGPDLVTSFYKNGLFQESPVQRALREINPNLGIGRVLLMKDAVQFALGPRRFVTRLLGLFAIVALILAAVGIYGTTTFSVAARTQEIGVRLALGAQSAHITRMILGEAGVLAASGVAIGLLASFGLVQFLKHLLFGVTANDPFTYVLSAVVLMGTALAAAYVPTYRVLHASLVNALQGDSSSADNAGWRSARRAVSTLVSGTMQRGTPTGPIIETHNLNKTFRSFRRGRVTALHDVSISVEAGTIFGLIGQNGAGKSTLIKLLLGLSSPDGGSASLLGCRPGDAMGRRRIGYLPESMRLPDHFTGPEFLHYMGRLNDVEPAVLRQRIPRLLARVGLEGVQKPVKTYSKGMLQRLGLAQALVNDPELLFLDEPTDGLDPLGRIDVRDLLLELRAEGKTIFLNSHLLSEIEVVCDRIVILDKGVVACTTTPAEFTHGTGEYVIRATRIDSGVRAAAEALAGPCRFTTDSLQVKPRDPVHLNELLDTLRRLGVQILAVEPVRLSLEKFFIQVVSEKDRGNNG
jgi:ABC-type multidrug transport system ATPase subunit/ABC-type antimicrobial peptide transport system permease subunit